MALTVPPNTSMLQVCAHAVKVAFYTLQCMGTETILGLNSYKTACSDGLTYNNHAFVFREQLSQQCVGRCAVHCSTNPFNCPQDKTECYKHCSTWHGCYKPVGYSMPIMYCI